MFIHWGLYSILGRGEWVMNNENISVADYTKLEQQFNPVNFNAHDWVALAKRSGMKYITLVTRHHDGFSMWDTKYSDFNIMHTPYHKDIVKQIADECHKQNMKIAFYYSLLDWHRDDYSYWTGRTGKGTGRTQKGNWADYIQFMKNQLTELLTNYGKIDGIWFDGYWDQTPEEGKDRKDTLYADWHIRELYDLIHRLQPQCLVGNNHHLAPLAGEDFQMFEGDVPGKNTSGLNFQKISQLPLETCATLNNSWGYNAKDSNYKTLQQIVDLLVNAAGSNGNLLLNIGPKADGSIPQPFVEKLDSVGVWLKTYGESIYGTRGGYLPLQSWGAVTQKGDNLFIHILNNSSDTITLPHVGSNFKKAYLLKDKKPITVRLNNNASFSFKSIPVTPQEPDADVVVEYSEVVAQPQ
jgi:alpha-L-fucosidase